MIINKLMKWFDEYFIKFSRSTFENLLNIGTTVAFGKNRETENDQWNLLTKPDLLIILLKKEERGNFSLKVRL